jgi:hypothetical protein
MELRLWRTGITRGVITVTIDRPFADPTKGKGPAGRRAPLHPSFSVKMRDFA